MTQTHARKTDPVSSHEAAQSNAAIRHIQVYEVVKWLGMHPGSTTAEIAAVSELDRHMVGRRMPDAEASGFVYRAGFRKCSQSNRSAQVWMRTDKKLPTE